MNTLTSNLLWTPEGFSSFAGLVIGCDEVGRGCMAGPVVAACVVFDHSKKVLQETWASEVRDSKLISEKKRAYLAEHIRAAALAFAVSEVGAGMIDEINIHNASLLSMKNAINEIHTKLDKYFYSQLTEADKKDKKKYLGVNNEPGSKSNSSSSASHETLICVDGRFLIPDFYGRQVAIVDGDAKIFSIAASSIVAKVHRDELMKKYEVIYPGFSFAKHKGYGTRAHQDAIERLGTTPIHRKTFVFNNKPVS